MSSWLPGIIVGLLGGGSGLGALGWYFSFRKDRREDTAQDVDLAVTLLTQVSAMQNRTTELVQQVGSLQLEVNRLQLICQVMIARISPIVEWIDAGCPDPAPQIPEDLRSLLHPSAKIGGEA